MLNPKFGSWGYRSFIRPVFFMFDAEKIHNLFISIGTFLGGNKMTKFITREMFDYQDKALEQEIFRIRFRNPIGLAAGFDKHAVMISIMEDVGFGFSEVGSVTRLQCSGNLGNRMKRLVKERSIWINFGLNNKGADATYNGLKGRRFEIPYGVSAAKTNCIETVNEEVAIRDYVYTLNKFKDLGNYLTINISCPNAFGGQPFSNPELFERLMKEVDGLKIRKPIFVKMSPDLTLDNLDKILSISKKHNVQGFICTNLIKNGDKSGGGYSGKMVERKSNEMIKHVYSKTKKWNKKVIVIGCGGIFSAEDAYKKIRFGASLVQLITGMIYEGPSLIGGINEGLIRLMRKDGFKSIAEAVGADVK